MQSLIIEKCYALGIGVPIPGSTTNPDGSLRQNWNFNAYMYAVLNFAITLGLALSGLMIIYAGIRYMLSRGDTAQTGEAKNLLLGAIIGFSLLLLVKLILKVLNIPLQSY